MECFYAPFFSSQMSLDITHFWFEDQQERGRQFFLTSAPRLDELVTRLMAYLICKLGIAKLVSLHPSEVPEHGFGALFHFCLLYLWLMKSNT